MSTECKVENLRLVFFHFDIFARSPVRNNDVKYQLEFLWLTSAHDAEKLFFLG